MASKEARRLLRETWQLADSSSDNSGNKRTTTRLRNALCLLIIYLEVDRMAKIIALALAAPVVLKELELRTGFSGGKVQIIADLKTSEGDNVAAC